MFHCFLRFWLSTLVIYLFVYCRGWVGLGWIGPRGNRERGGGLVVGVVLVLDRVCGHDSEQYL